MSERFVFESTTQEGIARLQILAKRYESERFIIDGIDEEARRNNRLVVEAIDAAGQRLGSRSDEIFGINMGGSRIKGYNTADSDIDLVFVTPDTVKSDGFVCRVIKEELAERGVVNAVDRAMGMWSQCDIKTDPEEFIYHVDHHPGELITLFGYTPYRNANMNLVLLSALEVVTKYTQTDYEWGRVAKNFADTYLGERDHLVPKFAERYRVSLATAASLFSPALFAKRYKKFGIEQPRPLYQELKRWYVSNKKGLEKYSMNALYNHVVERL